MKISQRGIDLIKRWEGCMLESYLCPANVLTIGYGHTKNVYDGLTISQDEADELLIEDLEIYEQGARDLVTTPLTQCQFDALVSFTFNLGVQALAESNLLKLLNSKKWAAAGDRLLLYNKANGKVLEGLKRRRQDERRLYYGQPFLP